MRFIFFIAILFLSYKALSNTNEPLINDGYITASKQYKAYSMSKPSSNLNAFDINKIWYDLTSGNYDKFKKCDFKIHYIKNNKDKSFTFETDATCTE